MPPILIKCPLGCNFNGQKMLKCPVSGLSVCWCPCPSNILSPPLSAMYIRVATLPYFQIKVSILSLGNTVPTVWLCLGTKKHSIGAWKEHVFILKIPASFATNMAGDVLRSRQKYPVSDMAEKMSLGLLENIQWCHTLTNVKTQARTAVTGLAALLRIPNTILSTLSYKSQVTNM